MKCLVVSAVFPPEPVVSSRTSVEIAKALAQKGHQVTVLAPFPNRPSGRLFDGYTRRLFRSERTHDGIKLIRCFSSMSRESNILSRSLENISFGIMAGIVAFFVPKPDVIYSNTWPIFAAGILALVAHIRGIPVVLSVQDMYPDSLISQGRIESSGRLARALRNIDTLIVKHSKSVVVISQYFLRIYRDIRGIAQELFRVVPNWVESKSLSVDSSVLKRFRRTLGIPDNARVCVFAGNIGVAAGVSTLLEAFEDLKDLKEVYLLIAGEGSQLEACRQLAQHIGNPRILFHFPYPPEHEPIILSLADLFLLPTSGAQSIASVPSKLLYYLMAGRPVIASAIQGSELAGIIEASSCGWLVEPDRPDLIARNIRTFFNLHASELIERGSLGHSFFLEHFTSQVCLPRILDIIENAATE